MDYSPTASLSMCSNLCSGRNSKHAKGSGDAASKPAISLSAAGLRRLILSTIATSVIDPVRGTTHQQPVSLCAAIYAAVVTANMPKAAATRRQNLLFLYPLLDSVVLYFPPLLLVS
ncbi:hypothetical protein O0L34_g8315 [Tuta absoluta]|nr:hypothetical protein O0L34_g8315 [Tuta absoluta]